ncbi:YiaAB two helix domain protein OS=Tsukamurella paurometabola (strain ATCC 8368 / DSM / CCUG 35730 / CIP 100753 / JCM 10117 / KCTC 9821 / NBRC 16120 / NCIMB 702349 / NCTC 13040) OX=521096 GN=Tpau_2289 PE=4 SV=1 [Tsukamurella paurometabola]|uniref:YiaAB two helix domain protein n=1 Tax=Tsukamurella paurometabola (strain ATCC 8368 / DSM 20162 / CCUG 35730 / CIP 100753 / JCM 10117 / KCTC 9821 / NBRC 16120 / NCIMB 702349 / NCTC 13040) TaxID=521096 RepID=D5UQC6_TSUPD|nr:YiaA/YiaB family inner membrane protein [Tsukamurella paurometabola]ADG78896.1 YiaAB two helix domain protein [Tsukamurella paurometabola DSM 20162]SUP33448.1 yiaA/B two helix domain [Tsukamurella paurometabola]
MTTTTPAAKPTTAFFVQSAIAFGVSSGALLIGAFYLPMDAWQRGFMIVGTLFLITSCFNLAKVVRDQQEANRIRVRVDEARLDKLMAEHDPLRSVG